MNAGTVTCELQFALADCYLACFMEHALVSQLVSELLNTQHDVIAFQFCIHRCYFAHWRKPFCLASEQ